MRIATLAVAVSLSGLLAIGAAIVSEARASDVSQPKWLHQTAFEYDNYNYFAPEDDGAEQPSQSPSDQPVPIAQEDASGCADLYCNSCEPACGSCSSCSQGDPCRLISAAPAGFRTTGWINGGILWNAIGPDNGSNGPVTFNDRDGEFLMNQLYVVMERPIDTGGGIGGRVDILYGTDARFTKAAGWELTQAGADRWNVAGQQYQLSIPQIYAEIGGDDVSLKLGHFYTIIGYEVVPAPDNFFYSHAYNHQYGEPFTHFGGLLSWNVSDRVTLHGGLVNGWDAVDRLDDRVSFLGGVSYTPGSERWGLAFSLITGTEPSALGPVTPRTMYSIVYSLDVTDRLQYVFQHDAGWQQDFVGGTDVEWYGIVQYLYYTINDCWKAGFRYEWFNDDDGTRVVNGFNPAARAGNWHELSLGLHYQATSNLLVRGECRWDWVDPHLPLVGGPFDLGPGPGRKDQFLAGIDVIYQF